MNHKNAQASFDRLIVLLNPASTNYQRARKWVSAVESAFSGKSVTTLETSTKGRNANVALLRAHAGKLGPRTLFCVAAGDGTVNFVINSLLTDSRLPGEARSTVVLPLWGGNGNDLASMLNGAPGIAKIRKVLKDGEVVPIHPLFCLVSAPERASGLSLAASYIGFGASGQMSRRYNQPAHRSGRLMRLPGGTMLQTAVTTWRALSASQGYAIEEAGRHKRIYERTVYNGPRVARLYHQPVQLTDDFFYVDTWRTKIPFFSPLAAILSFWRRVIARSKRHYHRHIEFTIKQPTWAQFDGEVSEVMPPTSVQIGIFERPFYALSTKVRPQPVRHPGFEPDSRTVGM